MPHPQPKLPKSVITKLQKLPGQNILAGCAVQYTADAIRRGTLAHIGIELRADGLHVPDRIVPPAMQGKYSRRNAEGWEETRRDLPQETYLHPVESPDWGNADLGTHIVWLPHQAYPKDFHPPRELALVLHCPDKKPANPAFVIAARIDEVLSQTSPEFTARLSAGLNILQENLGNGGAEPAKYSVDDYTRSLQITWDILSPESREDALQRLQPYQTANACCDFFQSLKPQQLLVGSSGFRKYFGALLEDDLLILESMQAAGAVYLLYRNWDELKLLNRLDLLSGRLGTQLDRFVRKDGWQKLVRAYVKARRQKKASP
jgi:hypothetical protein